MRFAYHLCTYNLQFRSRASGNALHVLLRYLKLAICQPEHRECTSRATCSYNLQFRSRASGNALHVLLWYLKLAICQPELRECAARTNARS